jgi:hypothetical protein
MTRPQITGPFARVRYQGGTGPRTLGEGRPRCHIDAFVLRGAPKKGRPGSHPCLIQGEATKTE